MGITMKKAGSNPELNIVSFDVPYPPDYGGVIDVFYKIKELSRLGIKIHLHCFKYGRGKSNKLSSFCENIFYYPRNNNLVSFFSKTPLIIKSRSSPELLRNLLSNDAPILFEGLHSTYYVDHPELRSRKFFLRAHNIEHDYYNELAKVELNLLKKIYLKSEFLKLKNYESKLEIFDLIFTVSNQDCNYFSNKHKQVIYTPVFQGFQKSFKTKLKTYALYHGNLSVGENEKAVRYLIKEVFSKLEVPFYIAGRNPGRKLKDLIVKYSNIKLFGALTPKELDIIVSEAKIHILPTFQSTGIKLKLVHALFTGGHIIINPNMTANEDLKKCCIIVDSAEDIINTVRKVLKEPVQDEILKSRENVVNKNFSNRKNALTLIEKFYK